MDSQQLRDVVELATMAPSIHNTQPWRFVLHEDAVDVYADASRGVPVIDPTGRQLHISCGGAVEHVRLAVRGQGRAADVQLLPDPAEPDLLARVAIGAESAPTPDEIALVRAIPRRHTHREPFDARPLPPGLVDELRKGVDGYGAWLHEIARTEDLVTTAVLLSHADEAERSDPRYAEELRAWTRARSAEPADGVPPSALPGTPIGERHSTFVLRDFDPDGRLAAIADAGEAVPAGERPFVVVLGTPDDDRAAWVQAGRALVWLLLRATTAGVTASPLNQVLDLPAMRSRFTRELRLLGHPQMLLRMGFGSGHPTTPRRPVDDVVRGG
jgi:nitroreductase